MHFKIDKQTNKIFNRAEKQKKRLKRKRYW